MKYESVMRLRKKLEELEKMKGITEDEKGIREVIELHVPSYTCIHVYFSIEVKLAYL